MRGKFLNFLESVAIKAPHQSNPKQASKPTFPASHKANTDPTKKGGVQTKALRNPIRSPHKPQNAHDGNGHGHSNGNAHSKSHDIYYPAMLVMAGMTGLVTYASGGVHNTRDEIYYANYKPARSGKIEPEHLDDDDSKIPHNIEKDLQADIWSENSPSGSNFIMIYGDGGEGKRDLAKNITKGLKPFILHGKEYPTTTLEMRAHDEIMLKEDVIKSAIAFGWEDANPFIDLKDINNLNSEFAKAREFMVTQMIRRPGLRIVFTCIKDIELLKFIEDMLTQNNPLLPPIRGTFIFTSGKKDFCKDKKYKKIYLDGKFSATDLKSWKGFTSNTVEAEDFAKDICLNSSRLGYMVYKYFLRNPGLTASEYRKRIEHLRLGDAAEAVLKLSLDDIARSSPNADLVLASIAPQDLSRPEGFVLQSEGRLIHDLCKNQQLRLLALKRGKPLSEKDIRNTLGELEVYGLVKIVGGRAYQKLPIKSSHELSQRLSIGSPQTLGDARRISNDRLSI